MSPRSWVVVATLFTSLLASRSAFAQFNAEKLRDTHGREGFTPAFEGTLTGRTGNSEGVVAGGAGILRWRYKPHLFFIHARSDYARFNQETSASRALAHARYNYEINPWLFGELFGQVQRDGLQRLSRRDLVGLGPRFALYESVPFSLFFGTAYMLEHELIRVQAGATDKPETLVDRSSNYVSTMVVPDDRVTFYFTIYAQPKIADASDLRILAELSLQYSLGKHFMTRIDGQMRYSSLPPTGVKALDTELKNAFEWKF
jgi:putative salt-induced outer membrane protein YdiY